MADYTKANIRLQKIDARNNKPHYNHLSTKERLFVKASEQVQQCERDMAVLERNVKNWRQTKNGQQILEIYLKAINKKMKLSGQLYLTEEQGCQLLASCHTSRFYGGSY